MIILNKNLKYIIHILDTFSFCKLKNTLELFFPTWGPALIAHDFSQKFQTQNKTLSNHHPENKGEHT